MKKFGFNSPGGNRYAVLKKGLIAMKITLLLILISTLNLLATGTYSQTARVSLKLNQTSIKQVLKEIERSSEFYFLYNNDLINVERKVDIHADNEQINTILDRLFTNQEAKYAVYDKQIVISPIDGPLPQEAQRKISGKVTDQSGSGIPGATVVVKGTTIGVITDAGGNYSVNLPDKADILVFSFVGMKTLEIKVANQTLVSVVLQEDTIGLEEVVAVGYGVQRKSDLAGSVGVASADQILKYSSFSALQGLKGKVAGVNIFTNSGNPSGNTRVIIRGINSINTSSTPLYVVDGVQMSDFQFINPNDIERVEVLKDASAAAIYGARGANGVILVTTKRGSGEGEGITVSYNGWVSLGTLAKKVDLMNSDEFMQMEETGFSNFSKYPQSQKYAGTTVNRTDPRLFDAQGKPLYNTDWQKEATRDVISHNHQFSIQQQGKNSSVGAFLNFTDQEGIMLNSYMKRLNAKLTYDANPKPWLSTGMNMMVNHIWANDLDETGGGQTARRTMWEMPSIIPVKFPDGSWSNSQFTGNKLNLGLEAMSNPVHELTTRKMDRYKTKIFGNASLTFHIIEGLDLKTQIGLDANQNTDKNFSPNDLINISSPNGNANISTFDSYYWQEETFLTYNKAVKKHRINALAGLSWSQLTAATSNTGNVSGFATNFFGYDNLGAGTTPSAPGSDWSRWAMNSYFLRGSYTYNDKYLATVTARVDGSSRFGMNNHYGFFPSAALGWVISNEDFLKDKSWLNSLKLHTSYGRTGSSEIGVYSTLATISSGTVLLNNGRAASTNVARLANPDLKWEKTDQFDFGFNLSMLKSRINLDLDYYYKLTSDLLLARPIPYSTGFSSVTDNIGAVSNRGLDILLTTTNIKSKDFTWESTFNVNYNTNRIEKLGANNEDILTSPGFVGGNVILRVGESLSSFYGYRRLGIWGTTEAVEAAKVGAVPGQAKRSSERQILGKGLPDWTGSFINTFNYKNWDFTVDLQFVAGVDTWQLYMHSMEDRSGIANGFSTILYNGWTETNQNTMVQQTRQQNFSGQDSQADSHWVSDGSYIRGNLIQLGYTFDNMTLKKFGLKKLRGYASVSNAFLIDSKDFLGYDPEATSNTDQFGQNIFFYQYPRPRTFSFGVNLSF